MHCLFVEVFKAFHVIEDNVFEKLVVAQFLTHQKCNYWSASNHGEEAPEFLQCYFVDFGGDGYLNY